MKINDGSYVPPRTPKPKKSKMKGWGIFFIIIGVLGLISGSTSGALLFITLGFILYFYGKQANGEPTIFSGFLKLDEMKKRMTDLEQESAQLRSENEQLKQVHLTEEQTQYMDLRNEIESLLSKKNSLSSDVSALLTKKDTLDKDIVHLEEEQLLQSFGFYETKYDLENSDAYKAKLDDIRSEQKEMIKTNKAVSFYSGWEVNGSKKEGMKMTNDNVKLAVRSFNNECDACMTKVKFNNIDALEKRIVKSFETLNKLNERAKVSITRPYLNKKLEELYLLYEYQVKKREEWEEQQRIKEDMREEQRALREIEAAKAKIEKEEQHFNQAIEALKSKLEEAPDTEKLKLEDKIKELERKLALVEKDKQDVFNREQNTRAGYVYIISNLGSFGEDVYKIGMTRRLEPMDRVKELGDASVPFTFDVHAMIFSEDAPSLENALHNHFTHRRVNQVNPRKEFFKVNLHEIERVVKEHHNKIVEFTKLAEAEEYRISLKKLQVHQ